SWPTNPESSHITAPTSARRCTRRCKVICWSRAAVRWPKRSSGKLETRYEERERNSIRPGPNPTPHSQFPLHPYPFIRMKSRFFSWQSMSHVKLAMGNGFHCAHAPHPEQPNEAPYGNPTILSSERRRD